MTQELQTTNEDPQYTGPRPAPTIPAGGTFSCYNKVVINAPAKAVYDAVVDTSHYGDWNQLVKKIDIKKAAVGATQQHVMTKGTEMYFHVKMGSTDATTKGMEIVDQAGPFVSKADDPSGKGRSVVTWIAGGLNGYFVKAEHVNWIDDNGDGTTTYQHWETFSGLASHIVKGMYGGHLHKAFIDWAVDLKAYVEKQTKTAA